MQGKSLKDNFHKNCFYPSLYFEEIDDFTIDFIEETYPLKKSAVTW
ncbi:MAG: hypothetical protein ACQEP5_01210 [Actinomycetota bacterium]